MVANSPVTLLAFVLVIGLVSCLTPIGLDPIQPYQLSKGQITTYQFSYIPSSEILKNAALRVTFPKEFDYAEVAARLQCMARTSSTAWAVVPCIFKDKQVILTLGQVRVENNYAVIGTPKNPSTFNMSSYFTLCMSYDDVVTDCNELFGKVIFSNPPTVTTGTVSSPSVSSLTSRVVGQGGTYQLTFDFVGNYAQNNSIRVTFPIGFTTKNPICQMTGTYNQVIETVVLPNSRSVECKIINKVLGQGEVLKIVGMTNPKYSGTFGNSAQTDYFRIELMSGGTNVILEELICVQTVVITPGTISASVTPENYFVMSVSTYSFYINLLNSLTSSDYIIIRFPNTWELYNDNCTAITGFTMGNNTIRCTNMTNSTYKHLKVWNFLAASSTAQLLLNVKLKTPNSPTSHDIEISTWNSQGTMDSVTISVTLNTTYGTVNMLSVNAITASAKVPAGGTGPLQMTFFLNYKLPQTNVLTHATLYVKIYPQIPTPPIGTNGVVKCYFFNTVPATTCTWDVSNSLYTLLTIRTPLESFYQYSEIPLTVTTEGATSTNYIGITIDSLVQRYRFELEFYKMTNLTTPTEVFYSEYIADAIQISSIRTIVARASVYEVNEWTHLQILMNAPISFTNSSKGFRFKLELLSGGGWAPAAGYTPQQLYKNFPCYMYGSGATDITKIKCDLYTYTSGPYKSLTATNPGPYILVYGFDSNLCSNCQYRFEFPRLLIGSSTGSQTAVRFSILEETPAMLQPYIELYYQTFTLFTTQPQSAVSPTAISMSGILSDSYINAQPTYTFTWTTPSAADVIIYQFDKASVASFSAGSVGCSTVDTCTFLGYPANWMVEYRSSGQMAQYTFPTSITTTVAANVITNGRYSGSFTFYAYAYNAGRFIKKASFTVSFTPRPLVTYSFTFNGETVSNIFKGVQQYYTVRLRPVTSTPNNGFIRLIFGGNTAPGALPYCSSAELTGFTAEGIKCSIESGTTIKVFNINGLSAGTDYYITVRLANILAGTGTISPTVEIRTYYSVSVDTSIVDTVTSGHSNSPFSNQYTIPVAFNMANPKVVFQTQKVGYIGKFEMVFTAATASGVTSTAKIQLGLYPHPYNGGFWSTPNSQSGEALVCFVNYVRVLCSYTFSSNILLVTMTISGVSLSQSSDNVIILDTEYIAPFNGIKYPSYGGFYRTDLSLLNSANAVVEAGTYHTRVRPKTLKNFFVTSACNDIGAENMFMVEFTVWSTSYPRSGVDGTTYSRIIIEFPTVDSLGNAVFSNALGGYTNTGDPVGCYFDTAGSYVNASSNSVPMTCRLIRSEVSGEPVRVEVLNHEAFTSSEPSLKMWIAKVFNPSSAVASINISIAIDHVTVSNNRIQQLYYDTFTVFMNSQVQTPNADVNQYVSNTQDYFENSRDVGDRAYLNIYMQSWTLTNGYYYVIQLPSEFRVLNQESELPSSIWYSCGHSLCLVFPQINYIVIMATANQTYVQPYVYFPSSISQVATTYNNLVWNNGRYLGKVVTTLSWSRWSEIRGGISSPTVYVEGVGNKAVMGRRNTPVNVEFTTTNLIPATGSIEVKFPSAVPVVYSHCRSVITRGSGLFSAGGSYSGEVGCSAQFSNSCWSWVVTGFSAVAAGTRVILYGFIDIPNQSGYLGTGQIITYSNQHDTNIRNNGKIIDYLWYTNFPPNIANSYSFNAHSMSTLTETLPLRTGYTGPLKFKFKVGASFSGQDVSRIQIRTPQTSYVGNSGGFVYDTRKKVCEIFDTSNFEEIGCMVTSVVNDTTTGHTSILYTIATSAALTSSTQYQLELTTQTGTPNAQGLVFPTVAGRYKVDINIDADGTRQYAIHNHLYLDVHGTIFKNLKVTSLVYLHNEWNMIWVELEPTTTIATTHQLVVQIPTRSLDGTTALFTDDLGTGLANNEQIKVDMLYGLSNGFMTCRLLKGDQANGKNAKVVCGNFLSQVATGTYIRFGFKVKNPSISSTSYSVPVLVYTHNLAANIKTNYMMYDNAINIRNSGTSVINNNHYIRSTNYYMQTSATTIQFSPQNQYTLQIGDAYVLFFGFPLRNNGKVTDGCQRTSDGTPVADAYYHYNNWVVVCLFKVAFGTDSDGDPSTRNFRVSSFYTPWFYLSSQEAQVTGICQYFSGSWAQKGIMSDGYKNENPKRPQTTPTVTLTPVVQTTTKWGGVRDDYTIDIKFGTDTGDDVSYSQLIAFIFPSNSDYALFNSDCVEGVGSAIKVDTCWIDTTDRVIYIRPVVSSSYRNNDLLRIVTRGLAVQNPVANISTTNYNQFAVKYYSWQNISEPTVAPRSNNNYCFLVIDGNTIPSSGVSFSWSIGSWTTNSFAYTHITQQRYYDETPYSTLLHRTPLEFEILTQSLFTSAPGTYHQIVVEYPSAYIATSTTNIQDLQVYKPVCYLNNNRIKYCALDTANRKVTMRFYFALPTATSYYVMVSLLDPRNADSNGFLYNPSPLTSISKIKVYMTPSGGSTSYIESDAFPAYYSLPSGTTVGPFRGIKAGSITFGTALTTIINPIHMTLTFNRTDVTGLVFEILQVDEKGNQIFNTYTTTSFFGLSDGAAYPCSNFGFSAGGNPKCVIFNGDNTNKGVPTRIFMTDFTYVQDMNVRLIIKNTDIPNVWLSIKVLAYGGTRSSTNLYGNVYMGYWNFMHIFKTVSYTGGSQYAANTYGSQPSQSNWRDGTTHTMPGGTGWGNMAANRMSMMEVEVWNSAWPYADKTICVPVRSSTNNYDDMIWVNTTTSITAYFIRTWPASQDIWNSPWTVGSVKCKHYDKPFHGYHYFDTWRYQYVTMSYSNMATVYSTNIAGSPVIKYLDSTTRSTAAGTITVAGELDLTPVLSAVLPTLTRQNGDSYILGISITNDWWDTVSGCRIVGGLTNSRGQAVTCTPVSGTDGYIYAGNFDGFQANPLLSSTTNYRVRFEITVSSLNNANATINVLLFANKDAYDNNLQRIFEKSTAAYDSSFWDVSVGNVTTGATAGNFILQKLSNTNIQAAFSPSVNLDYGTGGGWYFRFSINFYRFQFGSSCTVSSLVVQLTNSSTATPGTGVNNTVNPSWTACTQTNIEFQWDLVAMPNVWAGQTQFNINMYSIVYITVAGTNQDLPIQNFDWVSVTGMYFYHDSSWKTRVRDTDVWNTATTPTLATTATVATTSVNRGGMVQLSFYLGNLATTIGSASTGKILLVDFVGSGTWTGASDPLSAYTSTNAVLLIECQCFSGVGPLTLSSTTPFASAKCYRRLPPTTSDTYSITVDVDVPSTQDVTCYFPQWKIIAGHTIQPEFKTIYGLSFPKVVPGSASYGGFHKVLSSNSIVLTGSVPDLGSTYVSSVSNMYESTNLFASATTVQTTTTTAHTITIVLPAAQNRPYIYIDLNNGGPIANTAFCLDTNNFLECRAYNTYMNILVFRMRSTSVSTITITKNGISYPLSQQYDSTQYNMVAYITNSGSNYIYSGSIGRSKASLVPIAPAFTVTSDIYGSNKVGYKTNLLIVFSLSSQILYSYTNTGSRIVITFDTITTYGSYCSASVKNDVNVWLQCTVTSNTLTIISPFMDYTPADDITVTLGITNPGSTSAWTLNFYSKYVSSTWNWLTIYKTTTYTVDATETATRLSKSLMLMYQPRARISQVSNSPLRFRFKLPAGTSSTDTANGAYYQLVHSQIATSSTFECYFIEYASMKNMLQDTQNVHLYAPCSGSGTTLTVYTPRVTPLTLTNFYELVVMPIGLTGCVSGTCATQSGFMQPTNYDEIKLTSFTGNTASTSSALSYQKLYLYEGQYKIGLTSVYVLSTELSITNSLYISFYLNFTDAVSFPDHMIEMTFWDIDLTAFPGYTVGQEIPCQLGSMFAQITGRAAPRCVVGYLDSTNNILKVRIDNFGPVTLGIHTVSFDNYVLPALTGYSEKSQKFDLSISMYYPASNTRYENFFKQIFVMDGTNTTAITAPTITFNNPSSNIYGIATSTTIGLNWPFSSSTSPGSDISSKMVLQWNAGYAATWSTISSLSVSDGTNTFVMLWFNNKLNKAIFSLVSRSNNAATTLTISGLTNPYPYQFSTFTATQTFTLAFYYNYYENSLTTVGQPVWSFYVKTPNSLIKMNQNLPSNTLDSYVSSTNIVNRISPQALSVLHLQVDFNETIANVITRKLDTIEVAFTAGVSYVHECFAYRTGQVQINPLTMCHAFNNGTFWVVQLYGVTQLSSLTTSWIIKVWLKLSSSTVTYTSAVFPSSNYNEYQDSYPASAIASYFNSSRSIPTTLKWTGGKYVQDYFEHQTRYLEAVSNQFTPRYLLRMTTPRAVGSNDVIIINAYGDGTAQPFSVQLSTGSMICQWLPVLASNFDEYAVGKYSQCYRDTATSPDRYYIYAPYGGLSGEYLLQMSESDVINGKFRMPWGTGRYEFLLEHYAYLSTTVYDTVIYDAHPLFRGIEVQHTTGTVGDYDTLTVKYTPYGSVSAGGIATNDIALWLTVYQAHYAADGGINSIWTADGYGSFKSGGVYSHWLSNANASAKTVVKFGQHSNKYAPLVFSLNLQSAYVDNTAYIWRIPLLQNPALTFVPTRYNLTLCQIPNSNSFCHIYSFAQIINDYYTVANTSSTLTSSIISSSNSIQSNVVSLEINMGSYSLPQWNVATWKLDNSLTGLVSIPNFVSPNDTTNYNYYYFPTVNMVMAEKKLASSVNTIGIGSTQSSQEYSTTYNFNWIKVFSTSNVQLLTNPYTAYTKVPSALTLSYFNTYSASSVTLVEGIQNTGSNSLYLIRFTVQRVPAGGQVNVVLNPTYFSFPSGVVGRSCLVEVGFARHSSSSQVLRCFQSATSPYAYVIRGFASVTAGTQLGVYVYMKSIAAGTNLAFTVNIYGVGGLYTSFVSSAAIGTQTFSSTSAPNGLATWNRYFVQYHGTTYTDYYYELEGSFTLRTLAMTDGHLIQLYLPWSWTGNLRLIYRLNSTTANHWFETTPQLSSGTTYNFYLPTTTNINYYMNLSSEYIFKLTTYYGSASNGFKTDSPTVNSRFWFRSYTTATKDYNYYEVVQKARPQSFVSFNNRYRAAGKQTMFYISLSVDMDIVAGDQLSISFSTNSLLYNMFPIDVEGTDTSLGFKYLDCREIGSNAYLSNSRAVCLLYYGDRTATPPKPARLSIIHKNAINGYPSADIVTFMVATVKNPETVGMASGIQVQILRECRNPRNEKCVIYSVRGYYYTTAVAETVMTSATTFSNSNNEVLATNVNHVFQFTLTSSVSTSDVIYIVYPENHNNIMSSDCSVSGHTCYVFPSKNWVVIYPGSTMSGAVTLTISWMNNGHYLQASSLYIQMKVIRGGTAADVYNFLQPEYATLKRRPGLSTATSFQIAATQTPNIYLRNYANTVTMTLNYMFSHSSIKAFYVVPPVDVLSWQLEYCNATMSIPSASRTPYPLRFTCGVFNTSLIQVLLTSDFATFSTSWYDYPIIINAKFTLADFPTAPILYTSTPIISGTFYAYSSVSSTSSLRNFYISESTTTISISQHQVPIISHVTFNTKSFYYRTATINNQEMFYLLLKPTSTTPVTKIIFYIPREFDYPAVNNHDNCQMIGRSTLMISSCVQTRQNGRTLVTVTPTNYDNSVKILQLASVNSANWFTAPSLPGSFYNMTVEMYAGDGVLLEKQTVNISSVLGEKLDITQMSLTHTGNANTAGIFDMTFKIGTTQVPPGYNGTTEMSSEIQFIFENVNGWTNDLGTGLQTGDEIGCVFSAGLTVGNDRLKCILYVGTSVTDKPKIRVYNYAIIQPATVVTIKFSNVKTLAQGVRNTISVAIVIYYKSMSANAYLYLPTPIITSSTTNQGLTNLYQFSASYTGNNVVLLPANLTIISRPYYDWLAGNTAGYYYVLKVSPSALIDPYNSVSMSCSGDCVSSTIEIFYGSGMIRFRPSSNQRNWIAYTANLLNMPTSAYTIQNKSVTLTLTSYYNHIAYAQNSVSLLRIVEKCTLLNFGVISVSSLNGGEIGVTYVFSFQTNHKVPANAAVSITIPIEYGDMLTNNVTCTITVPSPAYCQINTPSRAQIYLNGFILDVNSTYTVTLVGLQNPNMDVTGLQFIVTTYFTSNIYLGQKICENSISVPNIVAKAIRSCGFSITVDYYNTAFNATYSFLISCTDVIRQNSVLYIKLPTAYAVSNPSGNITCWSYETTTLSEPVCTLEYIGDQYFLSAKLLSSSSQISLTLVVNLINPANNTYLISATFLSQGTYYAKTSPDAGYQVIIFNSGFLTGLSTNVYLSNIPKGAGISSTYVFKISQISGIDNTDSISISFPNNFNKELGSHLNIGTVLTTNSNLFSFMTYLNVDMLLANKSNDMNVSLYSMPTYSVDSNNRVLTISGLKNMLSQQSSKWLYIFVKGVQNPSKYIRQNFKIVYSEGESTNRTADWYFNNNLVYHISMPPNFLSIKAISASDYDLLFPSVYTFSVESLGGQQIAQPGQQLAIVITIPHFYDDTLWANLEHVCTLNTAIVTCTRYDDEIILLKNFTTSETVFTITVSKLLNPSSPTYCNTTDVNLLVNTYFRVKIMNTLSNDILFQTSAIVDNSTCMEFKTVRIPIAVSYPLKMAAGLIYNFSFTITKPAINLRIQPYCTSVGVSFLPTIVSFNSYSVLQQTMQVYLRSDMAAGTYTINFTKFESSTQTFFRNILPIQITVQKFDKASGQIPTINVSEMTSSTIGYPIVVPIVLSEPASVQMVLTMTVAEETPNILTYSPTFGNYTISPRVIVIPPNAVRANFTVSFYNTTVPPPLTLNFALTSLYPIIHQLMTPQMFLLFSRDPRYQIPKPPLRLTVSSQNISTANDVGKSIANIFVNETIAGNLTSLRPKIIGINSTAIGSTYANFDIYTNDAFTVYYVVMLSGYPDPEDKQALMSGNISNSVLTGSAESKVNNNLMVNYHGSVELKGLESKTAYNIFVVTKTLLGYSDIERQTFTTSSLSLGTIMKLKLTSITSPLSIVSALQQIFRILPKRIKVLTSNMDLQKIEDGIDSNKNTLDYTYEIVIIPDATNDNPTPLQIVKTLTENTTNLELLEKYLPSWNNASKIDYYEIRATKPIIHHLPTPKLIYFYNATFTMSFWQKANAYAVLIENRNASPNTLNITENVTQAVRVGLLSAEERSRAPSSKQIRDGADNMNNKLNKYRSTFTVSDINGYTTIFFNDLKPGSVYDMYVTASSILPYEPTMLYEDDEVLKMTFQTLHNPNLNLVTSNLEELKKMNPSLGNAISDHLQKNQNKSSLSKKKNR